MINNSHIFSFYYYYFFFSREFVFWPCYGGGGGGGGGPLNYINYMKQMQKTLMLILFDETSLTAIRTPQPILAFNHSA